MSNFFTKLKSALSKTSSKIAAGLEIFSTKKRLDEASILELEDTLIMSDISMTSVSHIIAQLRSKRFEQEITVEEIKTDLSEIIHNMISSVDNRFSIEEGKLNIIVVCGVNGNGKTTTIGKLASQYVTSGKKVGIAACDTFRAAAVDQIEEWSSRAGATLFRGKDGAEAASVAHHAVVEALKNSFDVLFIDTAGRLHNNLGLMSELEKVVKVIRKISPDSNYHCLLVLDSTTGQNALNQVAEFKKYADISGLIITKLDGTAKAGTVISIIDQHKLPVHFIGIGEKVDDLRIFDAKEFSKSLLGM
jgi:fused signal recognition particle receptor